jgi:uncharacterized membrane protein YidH (DUF202 family)
MPDAPVSRKDQIDVLFKFYQEHTTHARHHETQRSTTSTIMVAVAAGVAGLIKYDKQVDKLDFSLAVFLIAIGAFGAVFVYKQYERYRLHTDRAKRYRDALDALLPDRTDMLPESCFHLPDDVKLKEKLAPKPIKALKRVADAEHAFKYPIMHNRGLHLGWMLLQLFIASLGLLLAILTFPGWQELFTKEQARQETTATGAANPGVRADG